MNGREENRNYSLIEFVTALDAFELENSIETVDLKSLYALLKNNLNPRDLNYSETQFDETKLEFTDDGLPGDEDTVRWLIKDKLVDMLNALVELQKTDEFNKLDKATQKVIGRIEKCLSEIVSYRGEIILDTNPLIQSLKNGNYRGLESIVFSKMEVSTAVEALTILFSKEEYSRAQVFLEDYTGFIDEYPQSNMDGENLRKIMMVKFSDDLEIEETQLSSKISSTNDEIAKANLTIQQDILSEILEMIAPTQPNVAEPIDESKLKRRDVRFSSEVIAKQIPIDTKKKPAPAQTDEQWKADYQQFKDDKGVKAELRVDISEMSDRFRQKPKLSKRLEGESAYNTGDVSKYYRVDKEYWNNKFNEQAPPPIARGNVDLSAAANGPDKTKTTEITI